MICAGIFPAFHVGRVWMAWFLAPVPNANAIWQNFKSPLLWDVFAVSTYFTVSLIFWYLGLVPDLATIRDRCKPGIRKILYGIFALGWRGGNRQWRHYEMAYLLLAALSTPLVLSVHSVVSFDFATSIVPGWHTTIFPPYFVAGAIFGGFAMVLTLMVPARFIYGLQDLITMKHIDNMAKIILLTGTIVGYAYLMELFVACYSGAHLRNGRLQVPHRRSLLVGLRGMMSCNVLSPQIFWFKACRENLWVVMIVAMCVNVGMWFERFVIIVTTLARMFLPGDWKTYSPELGRDHDLRRHHRPFPRAVPPLPALPALHQHRRGEMDTSGVRSAFRRPPRPSGPRRRQGSRLSEGAGRRENLKSANLKSEILTVSTTRKRVYGYLAEFKSASALYKAAEKIRDAGFRKWDCYSPYPIHGLDAAMGMKRSILPWFVFFGGITGTATAFALAYTTQVVIYPTVVQAKPANIFTVPAFFPIMFELTILFSGFTTLFGLLALIQLPRLNHPLFASRQFHRATDDGFFIAIEARDPKFSPERHPRPAR